MTVSGKACPTAPWGYMKSKKRWRLHYQNCIPMAPVENPSRIFDSLLHSDAVQGKEYDWFCPVITQAINNDAHRGVKQRFGSATFLQNTNLEKCSNIDENSHCKSTQPLEQSQSPKLSLGNISPFVKLLISIF